MRVNNLHFENNVLTFTVVTEEEIKGAKYFKVTVSSSTESDQVIARLFYRKKDYSLGLVLLEEDNLNYDFEHNSPVAFFEDYPFDFPILERVFFYGYPYQPITKGTMVNPPVNKQRFFEANSLIQTTKSEIIDNNYLINTTLDLTIDVNIYLSNITWVSGNPWWDKYDKEQINEATAELFKHCQSELISYGYANQVLFQK